jgi:hypothetical protein
MRPPEIVTNETSWRQHDIPVTFSELLSCLIDQCLNTWKQISNDKVLQKDHSLRYRKLLKAREEALVMARGAIRVIFSRRLEPRSIAWIHQLARNFINTLDALTNAMLGMTSQPGFVTRAEVIRFELDRNISGYYALVTPSKDFGAGADSPETPYPEDSKNARDITSENIANIYRVTRDCVDRREQKAMRNLRRILENCASAEPRPSV